MSKSLATIDLRKLSAAVRIFVGREGLRGNVSKLKCLVATACFVISASSATPQTSAKNFPPAPSGAVPRPGFNPSKLCLGRDGARGPISGVMRQRSAGSPSIGCIAGGAAGPKGEDLDRMDLSFQRWGVVVALVNSSMDRLTSLRSSADDVPLNKSGLRDTLSHAEQGPPKPKARAHCA